MKGKTFLMLFLMVICSIAYYQNSLMRLFSILTCILCFTSCSVEGKEVPMTLWYKTPADATVADKVNQGSDDPVGWSSAWAISQYARLHQAEKAKDNLDDVMKKCLNPNFFAISHVFQIDANLGTTAGIAEMLLQSHVYDQRNYVIQLLPSLPTDWQKGEFSGLKARGGFEVAVKWENGQIVDASVKSLLGNKCRIWYNGNYLETGNLTKGETWKWNTNQT